MQQPDFAALRAAMIHSQLQTTGVSDPAVLAAFAKVPRERFVAPERRALAYVDEDQPVAPQRYLMEPMVLGLLLDRAEIAQDESVLIVGGTTGYAAAIVGELAATVVAVEEDAGLAERARATLGDLEGIDLRRVRIVEAPLAAGAPADAPFDVILFDGAIELVPEALLAQLRAGGRVAAVMIEESGVSRAGIGVKAGGAFAFDPFIEASTMPLPGFKRPRRFTF